MFQSEHRILQTSPNILKSKQRDSNKTQQEDRMKAARITIQNVFHT